MNIFIFSKSTNCESLPYVFPSIIL